MRRVHIDSQMWRYKIYKRGRVVIKSPDNQKYVTHIEDILDLSCGEVDRAYYKQSSSINVGPADIKEYIVRELIPLTGI